MRKRGPVQPTKADLASARRTIDEATGGDNGRKVSGRYVVDEAAVHALAILRMLATMAVCPDPTKAGKRAFVDAGGVCVNLEWRAVMPSMGANTRPDQGFENRMKAALRLADKSVGWGWLNHPEHGFVLVRTA